MPVDSRRQQGEELLAHRGQGCAWLGLGDGLRKPVTTLATVRWMGRGPRGGLAPVNVVSTSFGGGRRWAALTGGGHRGGAALPRTRSGMSESRAHRDPKDARFGHEGTRVHRSCVGVAGSTSVTWFATTGTRGRSAGVPCRANPDGSPRAAAAGTRQDGAVGRCAAMLTRHWGNTPRSTHHSPCFTSARRDHARITHPPRVHTRRRHAVVATARNAQGVTAALGEHEDLLAVALDVTDTDPAVAAVRAAVERLGHLDVLVHNAGSFNAGFFEEMGPAGRVRRRSEASACSRRSLRWQRSRWASPRSR